MASTSSTWINTIQPFVFGGISGMTATTIIQPIDMVKVRIQLLGSNSANSISNRNNIFGNNVKHVINNQKTRTTTTTISPITIAKEIIAKDGFFFLYNGLSAGLLRQATYTTARLGLFNTFLNMYKQSNQQSSITFTQRAIAGLAAGGLGAMVGNPCDLALIRMQSDGTLSLSQRANYTGVFNALFRIAKEEGILAWWKGCTPTVVRAMALNLGQLATYSETKVQLEKVYKPSAYTVLGASAVAGFFASFFSLPFDFIKTRLQKQRSPINHTGSGSINNVVLQYKGPVDCAIKVFQNEGIMAFYRGFGTYYVRIAPHAMITLLVADGLNHIATTWNS